METKGIRRILDIYETKYMQKIKDKCKELESLQSFKGELI